MCCLELFNNTNTTIRGGALRVSDLVDGVGVPLGELSRHILSLTVPKFKVLNRSSKGKELFPDDLLTVNESFSSKLYKVRVPLISAASLVGGGGGGEGGASAPFLAEESAEIQAQIFQQRKTMVDAAIVRIMKSRKSLDMSTLLLEVIRQLAFRFEPSTADVKKRIEDLIDRDYLVRDW